ncbi:G-protein coupled receptor 22-like [Phyllopteryx taeniolatus]|uniref:G-protein coupled receptor 22-like n=1 Tax=Phyllopteryx taeniolatus TaxID=161469 RepID=UPI002AD52A9A|nr:G-protein coupled receptor 22-like [Phyllopteryx taeniolatus]XP_061641924.1 G-protein coupled receptor 22-like [Phyllopteryx taeniolatus]XP_061641925.1 G-protein coupled receptor 22-like [Phyllopteryx taeniolatus]XP_061641926.1 G-protein coupled receptor 22-like [Phyllopteryx taeniolatus]XP_061641927.1 G-protein coupled receptor 22-like [Phyllopteryx taeniolatus]XP_061641928.1 G-protein coupled receptor 22-like [Phyllopteryx taeniolatus]XP_061641929.1 G-protein coupled receptor 22-like [Ph
METEGYRDLLETSDGQGVGLLDGQGGGGVEEDWSAPYPLGFQVSLTTVLILELVLGFSSNLTVLVLYCAQSNLVDSVSNLVTVNLHVLDILVCVLCLPLTVAVILLPANGSGVGSLATLCCFHEACVTFTSVATAVNVLVISLDRYDISVRPASRLLNPRRAGLLLVAVWAVSLAVFFLPFLEGDFFSSMTEDNEDVEQGGLNNDLESTTGPATLFSSLAPSVLPSTHPSSPSHNLSPVWQNRTLLCIGGQGYYTGMAMYYHLLLQVPCFFIAVVVMLFTYSQILQALNIRIGSHMMRSNRTKDSTCRIRCRRTKKKDLTLPTEVVSSNQNQNLSHPPLIPSPTPTPTSPPPLSSMPQGISDSGATVTTVSTAATTPVTTTPATPASPTPASGSMQTHATSPLPASSMGVQASVSAIIALRRAVRRHRDRRERQRRVLKMSLIIISTFLGCWAPLSAVNILILCMGPSDGLVRIRLCFLAMAYGTTIFHPLLYAFTRQKLRRALKTRVKKRVVSLLQVDPAPIGGTVIHNSWVEGGGQRKSRKPRVEASDGTDRCLTEAVRE